ncbi:hypothetical protein TNCV_1887081 [Trichonephila clavipes]|nr:hypothetical protein TNCV_1887081 [Trichonephila clavipes]
MQGRNCHSNAKKQRKKEHKQQHIKGTENILMQFYTKTVLNYDQKSSGRPERGAAWNSLRSRRFLVCHVSFLIEFYIRVMESSTEKRNGHLVHQIFHVTRIRIPSPFGHTRKGCVIWNMLVQITSWYNSQGACTLQSAAPYTIGVKLAAHSEHFCRLANIRRLFLK